MKTVVAVVNDSLSDFALVKEALVEGAMNCNTEGVV
jgi:hypothetical protein